MTERIVDIAAALEEAGFRETEELRKSGVTSAATDGAVNRIGRKEYLTDAKGEPIYVVMDAGSSRDERRNFVIATVGFFFLGAFVGYLFASKKKKT